MLQTGTAPRRLRSLDVFRGLTIAAMIIVNNPGTWDHVYAPLLHADWHGITPTDFIFPFFLFIVGVSITLAYHRQLQAGRSKGELLRKAAWRAVKIFAVGIFLNLWPEFHFAELRIPGVLQRIAIVFFIGCLFFLYSKPAAWVKWSIIILIGYWLAMRWIPVPGVGTGVLEPGRNLAAFIDSKIIPLKMWQGTWDPEGLLSTIPAVVTCLGGMLVGNALLRGIPNDDTLVRLLIVGFGMLALGYAWHWVFPINKNLWTSSFVLVTAGLATLTLGSLIWIIDRQGLGRWAHFGEVFGANAITVYVLAGMLPALMFAPIFGGESINSLFMNGLQQIGLPVKLVSFLYALGFTALLYLPALWLYKRKIYIKL